MMPGCFSSSRSRLGPDLELMRLLISLSLYFAPPRIFEPMELVKVSINPEVAIKMSRRPCDVGEASSLCTLGKKQSGDAPMKPTPPCRRPILIATNYMLSRDLTPGRNQFPQLINVPCSLITSPRFRGAGVRLFPATSPQLHTLPTSHCGGDLQQGFGSGTATPR